VLHWTKLNQNWNFMCAECHSTGVHKNYDAANDRFATTWAEISVGCEACHGQGSHHAAWARTKQSWWPFGKTEDRTKGLLVPLDERRDVVWRIDPRTGNAARNFTPALVRREVETCGRCHARRGEFSEDWVPGRSLSDTHVVSPLARGLYYPDGQMRDEVLHPATGPAFADILVDGHRETWPIRSKRFRAWLRRCYYQATGGAASAAEVRSALDLLEARAQFDGPERAVHVRIAEHAGHVYLDLADEHWRAVDIGPDGWRVIGCPPVRFRRSAGMLPLPVPQQGGSIESLNSFLNLASRDDFVLIVAWLLAALRSGGPYPLLAISGEQDSAKTVLSKLLKALIDPNAAPVRSLSREERELMIAANNGYLLAFDNLSGLPVWLSDALCRLASGGSFAVRRLYSDDDEVLFEAARPILLNGIEEVISRPDLGDRALFLTLAPIGEGQRRLESELWREFEVERPRVLGALLDAVVHGLRAMGRVHLDRLPRMADFALWAAACETALWPAGTFARAYAENRRIA